MEKKKLGTGAIVGIVILAVLSVSALVCNIVGSIQGLGFLKITPGFVSRVIMLIATVYYASAGYKRPHGNLLRAIFILLSLTCLNGVIDSAMCIPFYKGNDFVLQLLILGLDGFSALLISYIGGRLDKIKKNIFPLILITAAQVVKSVLFVSLHGAWSSSVRLVWNFSTCILWLDIAFAYILRYKEHKEAGLADK